MTGKLTNQPVADPQATQPPKTKKGRSKFSAQASQRIEALFSELDQEPLLATESLAEEIRPPSEAAAQVILAEAGAQPELPSEQPLPPALAAETASLPPTPPVVAWQDLTLPGDGKSPIAQIVVEAPAVTAARPLAMSASTRAGSSPTR